MKEDIFSIFENTYKEYALQPAIFFRKNNRYCSITYEELYRKVISLSNFLTRYGVKKGKRVAIILENNPWWPVSYFGIVSCQAIAVPLNYQLPPEEFNYFISHSESDFILTSSLLYPKIKDAVKKKCLIFSLDSDEILRQLDAETDKKLSLNFSGKEIASIVYTSGTTKVPRGVMLTHKNLLSNLKSLQKLKLLEPDDCFISILPFHHTYPFMTTLLLPLLSGLKISFPHSLEIGDIMECIQETKVTIIVGVPRLFSLLGEKIESSLKKNIFWPLLDVGLEIGLPLRKININLGKIFLKKLHLKFGKNLKFMVSGGAKLPSRLAKKFYKWGFTLLEGYGLTETSPVISLNTPKKFRFGSVGEVIPEVKVKIHSPDESGIGEIIVKGENVMLGYYRAYSSTQEVIKNGWLHTKDLGYIDKEGFIHIQGRKNEVIILSSGKKINPEEVEARYLESPYIKEICVFLNSEGTKELLSAVILPDYEYFKSTGITRVQDKIRWEVENISSKLPPYQRIQKYKITTQPLPRTSLGKIKRYLVKKEQLNLLAQEEKPTKALPEDAQLLSSPICRKALEYLASQLKSPFSLDDHLELDLGLDSLEQIQLFLGFQKVTGVKIRDEDALGIFTVRDALKKLYYLSTEKKISSELASTHWRQILYTTPAHIESSIKIKQTVLEKVINFVFLGLIWIILKTLFLLKVKGRENLPKQGPYIICPNHASYLDGFVIAASLGPTLINKVFFLGYSVYFQHPLIRWMNKLFRLISVDPVLHLIESMQSCSYVLRNSKILCMFPEGVRSPDGKVKGFKKGAGILAKELNIPIVPVYIQGTFEAWSRYRKFPKPHKVEVVFGKKILPSQLQDKKIEEFDIYQFIADSLREEVIKLSKKSK